MSKKILLTIGVVVALILFVSLGIYIGQNYKVISNNQGVASSIFSSTSTSNSTTSNSSSSNLVVSSDTKISTGTVKGSVSYPSDRIPAQTICLLEVTTKKETCLNSKLDQAKYELQVSTGKYQAYVSAWSKDVDTAPVTQNKRIYYTQYVKDCMQKDYKPENLCSGSNVPASYHTNYITFEVKADEIIDKIDPVDWYAE
jgi:hypothetical protein